MLSSGYYVYVTNDCRSEKRNSFFLITMPAGAVRVGLVIATLWWLSCYTVAVQHVSLSNTDSVSSTSLVLCGRLLAPNIQYMKSC